MSDPNPAPRGELSDAAVGALRRVVQMQLQPALHNGDLRDAIRVLCSEVHHDGLQAEQLIITVKQTWQSLPEVQRIPPGTPRNEILARIVTLCIEEFYAGGH